MTNKKTTLRALLLSLISVLACVAMLVGSTFAWFTDSVSSMNNIIKSGNLDVVLEYSTDGATWAEVDETTKIFDDAALYEPGYTEVVFLRVSNAGSLALKYQLGVNIVDESSSTNVYDEEFFLSDYLQVGFYNQAEYNGADNWGALLPFMFADRQAARNMVSANSHKLSEFGGMALNDRPVLPGDTSAELIALVLYMPEEVGNEANHKTGVDAPEINLGVNLLATQFTHESDSFGPDYDEDATYPTVVNNAADLAAALAAGGNVELNNDIVLDSTVTIPAGVETVLNLNGHNITNPATSGVEFAITNNGTLTIDGEGTLSAPYAALYSTGKLTVNGGNFVSSNGFGTIIDNINGTTPSVATINGGTFQGVGVYNPVEVTINGGTFNEGRDPDGAYDDITLLVMPAFAYAPQTAVVTLNGGTFNGDVYVYDDGHTETVFTNNGATITGSILDNA